MVQSDLLLSNAEQLWLWCKHKQIINSIDIAKYGLANYYLRANRTIRDWAIPKEISKVEPRLNRLDTQEKIRRGLYDGKHANIAVYELNPKWSAI